MAGTLSPVPWQTFFDDDGTVLAGGKLYTFAPGLVTPKGTFSNVALTVPNANPIILDAAGRCVIYLQDYESYGYELRRSNDTLVRTQDNIPASNTITGRNLGEYFHFGGESNEPITATSYPVGTTYAELHGGTHIWTIDPANIPGGTYIFEAMMKLASGGGGVTVLASLFNLDGGPAPIINGEITSTSTVGVRVASGTLTFPGGGLAIRIGMKVRVANAGGPGFVWGARIVRTA